MIMANSEYPKAYYPGQDYDQSSWMHEKAKRLLESLCRIIDSGYVHADNYEDLHDIAKYACLLYTFWCGKRELYDVCLGFVIKNGSEGFKRFRYIYGLSDIIDEESKHEKDKETEAKIMSLIGPERTNRTLIHNEIRNLYYKSDFIKNLEDDLYKVTFGEESWDWFVSKYKK